MFWCSYVYIHVWSLHAICMYLIAVARSILYIFLTICIIYLSWVYLIIYFNPYVVYLCDSLIIFSSYRHLKRLLAKMGLRRRRSIQDNPMHPRVVQLVMVCIISFWSSDPSAQIIITIFCLPSILVQLATYVKRMFCALTLMVTYCLTEINRWTYISE